ncbi:uncharacterized protein [Misgurnus anguillicaudatus]|uniref:uncharacterized protein isoform X2 n=1 Tax=Misgurnus anguillicaudatus TaxID=75329 RepID=UPI003CCF24B4
MTTRILESFNVLDRHSKSVFSKYAKVNHLTSVPESDFLNKVPLSKSKTEIASVSEDTHLSPPKKVAHVVSMKAISSKVSIRPFTSPEDLALRRSTNVKKDKEGFMTTTLKKPVRPSEPTIHRMKWSKEVKKMPPLDIMSKASSTVLVGGALNHTKTSQWCSSQSNNSGKMLLSAMKDNEPFIVPGSTGEVIAQQLHLGNVVRIGTNEPYKRANKNSPIEKSINEDFVFEPVPLCFDDELERKNVKVLTARSPTVYKDLPIVSETYPLISDQNQYEPFKSPGLHILDTSKSLIQNPDSVLNCKVGIIRMSYSLRKASTVQSMRKSQRGPQTRHKTKKIHSEHILSADGNVLKNASEGPIFIHCYDVMPSSRAFINTSKSPAVPLPMPRQRRIAQTPVGLVVNGINPSQSAERSPSDNLKTIYKMTKGRLQAAQSQRPVATQNGMDFIVISRPLQSGQNLDFVAKQRCQEEFWSTKQDNISHNYEMSRVLDDEKLALNVESFSVSRPNSSVDHPCQDGAGAPEISTLADPHSLNTMDEGNTCLETIGLVNDSETLEANCYLQWSSAINIPTAGCD